MENGDRSAIWRDIWIKKGQGQDVSPITADGFAGLITVSEFDNIVNEVVRPLGLMGNEKILECGCGAGLFLSTLLKFYPGLQISGIDYSPTLIEIARSNFPGNFNVADMTDLGIIEQGTYDFTLSFSAIHYLSSEQAAYRAVSEMNRVTKPKGRLYIGDVPDAAKKDYAESIRRVSHQALQMVSSANPDHLYLSKDFFKNFADQNNLEIKILDHTEFNMGDYQAAKYRYSVYLKKND